MNIRVGQGYDVHKLAEGESFILGGVELNHFKGTVAHSDGDVLIHAICDALLGAANMRDIGFHFPDTSFDIKGIDSKIILKQTKDLIQTKGFFIGNIDCTVCLERPKLKNHIEDMKNTLAEVLALDVDKVSIKATTTEKLGFVGREEGVSSQVVVLIYQS